VEERRHNQFLVGAIAQGAGGGLQAVLLLGHARAVVYLRALLQQRQHLGGRAPGIPLAVRLHRIGPVAELLRGPLRHGGGPTHLSGRTRRAHRREQAQAHPLAGVGDDRRSCQPPKLTLGEGARYALVLRPEARETWVQSTSVLVSRMPLNTDPDGAPGLTVQPRSHHFGSRVSTHLTSPSAGRWRAPCRTRLCRSRNRAARNPWS